MGYGSHWFPSKTNYLDEHFGRLIAMWTDCGARPGENSLVQVAQTHSRLIPLHVEVAGASLLSLKSLAFAIDLLAAAMPNPSGPLPRGFSFGVPRIGLRHQPDDFLESETGTTVVRRSADCSGAALGQPL